MNIEIRGRLYSDVELKVVKAIRTSLSITAQVCVFQGMTKQTSFYYTMERIEGKVVEAANLSLAYMFGEK